MVCKIFDKKSNSNSNSENPQSAEKLHKTIIRKFQKRKVYSSFRDHTWGADLANTKLISKYITGIIYLLCVINIYSKYASVVPLKEKKKYRNY